MAAAGAAAAAVRDTPGQLPELARAGVVDAGGLGLCVVLDALAALVTDREPAASAQLGPCRPRSGPCPDAPSRVRPRARATRSCTCSTAPTRTGWRRCGRRWTASGTRSRWSATGRPEAGTWTVHVHCTDIGAAVEAGVAAGRPHGIRVVPLVERAPDGDGRYPRARAVLAVTCGPHVAALARERRRGRPGAGLPGPGRPGRRRRRGRPRARAGRHRRPARRAAALRRGARPGRGAGGGGGAAGRAGGRGGAGDLGGRRVGRARRARPGPAPGRRRRRDDRGGRRYPHRGGAGRRVRGVDLGRPLPAR